ncbi:MAG: YeeE/YedE family protein [Proteobacteria bacterium]|nr:YeeE/YedE family protein [Pseudomonadota bacterium]
MKLFFTSFGAAILFGLGLGLSGMTLPSKVIGFLDITGNWDPTLAFVMVGAILVHSISFRLITKRPSPIFSTSFRLPTRKDVDYKLVVGAAIFGLGWGLGGFCPGPAIVGLVSGIPAVLVFVGSMVAGIYAYRFVSR